MRTIKQKYLIKAPVAEVWKALVEPKVIDLWGGGPARMEEKAGTKFSLWGGDIHGKNIEVTRYKQLVQEWFSGSWKKPSRVTFTLTEKGPETEVELLHVDVPDEEGEEIAHGWKTYYLGSMKELLEK